MVAEPTKITFMMIVDDDPDDREFFREALGEIDQAIECLEAVNGEDALRLLQLPQAVKPELIFLDLNMPRMDGQTFLRQVKLLDPFCLIPVIIFTTSKRPEDRAETQRLGADYFITKPSSFVELRQVIAFALKNYWEPEC